MKKNTKKYIEVDDPSYNIAIDLLKLSELKDSAQKDDNTKETDQSTNISGDAAYKCSYDYSKWEEMSKHIQLEEIVTNPYTSQILKLENKNDIRRIRQPFEKISVSKFEACLLYKNQGDQYLTDLKDYEQAQKIYDIALSFLFITKFNEDEEETKRQKELRNSIYMNLSFCKIQRGDFKGAIDFLIESHKHDDKNLKTIYRLAHCYFKLNEEEKSLDYIKKGFIISPESQEFKEIQRLIDDKRAEDEKKAKKIFLKSFKAS